jgi:hypothetical protein
MKDSHRDYPVLFALLQPRHSCSPTARRLIDSVRLWPVGLATLVFGSTLLIAGCNKTPVPTDPVTTGCSVSATEFNTWFETGAVSLNGVVKPASSLTFSDNPNCDFYKWSEQMFLWLNSPAPSRYGGGAHIFNSPAFYDVSPLDANFDRTFIAHPSGNSTLGNLSLRAAQVGQHGLPVIMSRRGTMLEIESPQLGPTGKQLILNESGKSVEIERITIGDNKRPVFFDKAGKEITGAKPLIRTELTEQKDLKRELIVEKFMVDKAPIFLDLSGNLVEMEQGQADGSILMAQNGSLVYYQIMVNDVYAYFLTGVKKGQITPGNRFPTTPGDLTQIKNFAIANGLPSPDPFPDSVALAVEVKTAWVEASGLANPSSYITMTATIPTYDGPPGSPHPNTTTWTPNGQKTVLMALVAMHVVGSTFGNTTGGITGHPEMLWATFDHENNAPNASYTYDSTSGPKTVNPDFSAAYLFCATNPDTSHLNEPHMQQGPSANIVALGSFTISPSNTIRGNAWGGVDGVSPNPIDATVSASNSELISINNNVRGMLNSGDVRTHYIMTGSTWTIDGFGFNGNFGNPGNNTTASGTGVGTSQMANTTMETYQQILDPITHKTTWAMFSNNCFSCHHGNTTSVSHIFTTPGHSPHGLKPLF